KEVPESPLLVRRKCQALAALGRRDEAIDACTDAMKRSVNNGLVLRATAASLMSGKDAPSSTQVGYAMLHAERLRKIMQNEPWSAAAECDVAAKLGDMEMLNQCVARLRELAPDHYETKRYEAILTSQRPGLKSILGLGAFVLLVLGALVHA